MEIKIDKDGRNMVVLIKGEIDHHTAEEIREKIEKEYSRSNIKNIIFDFKDVTFMDSSGVGMVIGRYKTISKNGGSVAVSGIRESAFRIFEISGLKKILNLYGNAKEAMAVFK